MCVGGGGGRLLYTQTCSHVLLSYWHKSLCYAEHYDTEGVCLGFLSFFFNALLCGVDCFVRAGCHQKCFLVLFAIQGEASLCAVLTANCIVPFAVRWEATCM